MKRAALLDVLLALGLGGAAFGLYLATLAPTVLAGDGGEFQFVPYLLGVAHPTGYPLYCLLGWAWSHLLPVGDVAYRMNLFSALSAAAAVALVYMASLGLLRQVLPSLSIGVHRLLGVLAAAFFASTPTFWSQSTIAEVYGLHLFIVALFLYLLLRWGERHEFHLLVLAAGCFGLGLAHHRTTLLLAPAALAYVWLTGEPGGQRQTADRRRGSWRWVLAAALLPLLLYLYIPLRAPHTPYLRLPLDEGRDLVLYEDSISTFFDFVLGGPFGGSLDLSVDLGQRLSMAWNLLLGEVGWMGVLLALAGLVFLAARGRWPALALTGLIYVATVAFNLVYTIGDIFVLFIPSYLMVALWAVVAIGALADLVTARIRPSSRLAPGPSSLWAALMVLPFCLLPLWGIIEHYGEVDQSGNTAARSGWESILSEPLPSRAALISNDRNDIMPLWYFQYVEGRRPDLLGLFPLITPDYPTLGEVLDLGLSTDRPLYLIKEMPGIEVKVAVEAEGDLWHVVAPAVQGLPQHLHDGQLDGAVALNGYDVAPSSPRPGEDLQLSLYWQALHPLEEKYHSFVHLLDDAGQRIAQSDHQPGGVFYPAPLWQPGEAVRDVHSLTVPAGAPPGTYHLLVGMYTLSAAGELQSLGEPISLGQLGLRPSP
ncbi:MAG: glycosyltransferase family 117 protein [Anaerolineae bacterium]